MNKALEQKGNTPPTPPFRSAFTAQVWREVVAGGVFLPLMAGVFILGGKLLIAQLRLKGATESGAFEALFWGEWYWYEALLPGALIFAGLAWSLRSGWRRRRAALAPQPGNLPLDPGACVAARLAAEALHLIGLVVLLAFVSFLLSRFASETDHTGAFLLWRYTEGLISLREYLRMLVSPLVLCAGVAWILMQAGGGRRFWLNPLFGCGLLLLGLWLFLALAPPESFPWKWEVVLYVLWFCCLYPCLMLAGALLLTWRRGQIHLPGLVSSGLLLGGIFLFFYPPISRLRHAWPPVILLSSLAYSAAIVYPAFKALLALPAYPPRPASGRPVLLYAIAAGGIAVLAWISWPTAPHWQSVLRAQGLPDTVEALHAAFPEAPREENLAYQYIALEQRYQEAEKVWGEKIYGELGEPYEEGYSYPLPDLVEAHVLICGADCEETPDDASPKPGIGAAAIMRRLPSRSASSCATSRPVFPRADCCLKKARLLTRIWTL